ncbi:MAG: hypothetical protein KGL78_14095 [Burkholderiales bacterium]|nr:hypothetical protein [Burkholderiales bacterium]
MSALLHGGAGIAIVRAASAALTLPIDRAAGALVLPVPGGLWTWVDGRRLERWRCEANGHWAVAASRSFDTPVHALASSADGGFVFAAHGDTLSLLDDAATLLRRYVGSDLTGRHRGRAGTIVAHAGRRSVVVSWPTLGEWWEISLDPAAPPIFDGLVHDYRMAEAIAAPGYLGVRRAPLGTPMPEPEFVDARVPWLAGCVGDRIEAVNLDIRRRIGERTLPGAKPGASLLRRAPTGWTWWLPAEDALHVLDTTRWQTVARHALPADADGTLQVRSLQELGGTLWMLAASASGAGLWRQRDASWQHVATPAGRPVAMRADAARQQLLVALAEPTRLVVLDEDGALREKWELPNVGAPLDARWLIGCG